MEGAGEAVGIGASAEINERADMAARLKKDLDFGFFIGGGIPLSEFR